MYRKIWRYRQNSYKQGKGHIDCSVYNTKTVWPDDQPTPWFRNSAENSKKLQEITKQLAEDESYTFPRAGLGIKAIDEIIRKYMQERRRKENDPLSSQSDQDSSESSSKGSPSILSARQDKVQSSEAYFIDDVLAPKWAVFSNLKSSKATKAGCGSS